MIRPENIYLHELPYTEMVKSGTIRLASELGLDDFVTLGKRDYIYHAGQVKITTKIRFGKRYQASNPLLMQLFKYWPLSYTTLLKIKFLVR